ncbi:ATP-binding protein [Granulicella sp. 5B5]|uniref:ATP-binding protein n=1 Tax=Granulicella sp. 5B5 TaxID=1617967 RepID=UPI0015F3CAC6|nr:ATP-binding protein [Granulicella sp. 5B5]
MYRKNHIELQSTDEAAAGANSLRYEPGIRTHILLVVAMAAVIAIITSLSLLLIRQGLQAQITENLTQDLSHSVRSFQDLQNERLNDLRRENALLAELPTLKALMTSGDEATIRNGATEFWHLSGADLFVLTNAEGQVLTAYTKDGSSVSNLQGDLDTLLASPGKHYLIHGNSLYACAIRPLFFGADESGTILGYVISGSAINRSVEEISRPTGVDVLFLSGDRVVAGSLARLSGKDAAARKQWVNQQEGASTIVKVGNARYLSTAEDFSSVATAPLRLIVLKSLAPAEQWISRINRMILAVGAVALCAGTILMIFLSRSVTRPLEELSRSVLAFGTGDDTRGIPSSGTQEIRHLAVAFAGMRVEIQQAHAALLESERLATIGRMANSVSHDLRHYLATVYANAEFLASDNLPPAERAEIFNDIRTAVNGTTDMIESLLIFSRSGNMVRRAPELLATLLERSVGLMRRHPDAANVTIRTQYGDPTDTAVMVDGKQIERAIYNLLLNACQAPRPSGVPATVLITLESDAGMMIVRVIDNGIGIPASIRNNLFEPFVSEGKQKGTGLGLTLVQRVALDHGGDIRVRSSIEGETIFEMLIAQNVNAARETNAVVAADQLVLKGEDRVQA